MSVQPDYAPPVEPAVGEEIPTIDIGPLLAGVTGAIDEVAGQMHRACTEIGFFFIVNHGMDADIVERAFDASRQYFDLPFEEKRRCG